MKRTAATALALACILAAPSWAALKPGDEAPAFTARAALGGKDFIFSLADALKKGPVVLYFFPKAFTTGCTAEAHEFAEAAAEHETQDQGSGDEGHRAWHGRHRHREDDDGAQGSDGGGAERDGEDLVE